MSHRLCWYCKKELYSCSCKGLTSWEAGNILADLQDVIADKISDLNKGKYPDLADKLKPMSFEVGKIFNSLKAHSFQLPDGESK